MLPRLVQTAYAYITILLLAFLTLSPIAHSLVIASSWGTNITQLPQAGWWICKSDKKIVVEVQHIGLSKIVLKLGTCSIGVLDSQYRPIPYYIDYCNGSIAIVWINTTTLTNYIITNIESWSNGYLTFSKIVENYLVTYFTDFSNITGWIIVNGSISKLGYDPTLNSYAIDLSSGTVMMTMLHELQRMRQYILHMWTYITPSACLGIVLGYGINPLDKTINITLCRQGLHYITINVTHSVSVSVDGKVVDTFLNKYYNSELTWIIFKAYRGNIKLYKLYITPVHYSHGKTVTVVNTCVKYMVEPYTMNRTILIDSTCRLECGVLSRKFSPATWIDVPTITQCHISCTFLNMPIINITLNLTKSEVMSRIVPVWEYVDYTNKTMPIACLGNCTEVSCSRNCGIIHIIGRGIYHIAIRYNSIPTYLKVVGHYISTSWSKNTLYITAVGNITIMNEYLLEIFYIDAKGRIIAIPGARVIVDGKVYPIPFFLQYPAGRTNVTAVEDVLGFKFLKWRNSTSSRSVVIVLDHDTRLVAIYRIPTRLIANSNIYSRDNSTIIEIYGKLVDFYGSPIPNVTISITCNSTRTSTLTDNEGTFRTMLHFPPLGKNQKIVCILEYSGNSTYLPATARLTIVKMPPVPLGILIAFTIIVIAVLVYVIIRRYEKSRQSK